MLNPQNIDTPPGKLRGVRLNSLAFTLFELMIVLAVVILLGVTLLPALASPRPTNRTLQCMNNLRQWGASLQQYASENSDAMPRDGFDASGQYVPGDSFSGNAWFNQLPQLAGEKPLSNYTVLATSATAQMNAGVVPFPGGLGKIWHCAAATMTGSDFAVVSGGGRDGFFSYCMNMDLKRSQAGYANSDAYPYPTMPKVSSIRIPAATVFMFDAAFSPTLDVVNSSPQFNSVNPANRWRSAAARHDKGGNIVFVDGHVAYYKWSVITNSGTGSGPTLENPASELIWNPNSRP